MLGNPLLVTGDDGYQISRSVRLRSSASAYFNRTPASAGNRKTWTWSAWVKRGSISSTQTQELFSCALTSFNNGFRLSGVGANTDTLHFQLDGGNGGSILTNSLLRDPSAWYHIVLAVDTTLATSTDRLIIYVNGIRQTTKSYIAPSQNYTTQFNNTVAHEIGRDNGATSNVFDGYLTEVNFIDGQALTPSDFGETDATTGVWKPKKYAGTYGTNGFYLDFKDPTTTTTLTADKSGNGNNWTANNISLTSGATYDSMIDTPTPVADVRGNFAVLNPLTLYTTQMALADGNLQGTGTTGASNWGSVFSTINLPTSGKWYVECIVSVFNGSGNTGGVGVIDTALFTPSNTAVVWQQTSGEGFDGLALNLFTDVLSVRADGVQTTSVSSLSATSYTLMLAVDIDAGKVWGGYDGTWVNSGNPSAGTGEIATRAFLPTDTFVFHTSEGGGTNTSRVQANFGQRPFAYTPPSGFKALHTGNLPEPAIVDGGEYFNTVLYTGNGIAPRTISGVGFQPDFVWTKSRSNVSNHALVDSVRGGTKALISELTDAEYTGTWINSFNSDGYVLGDIGSAFNLNGYTYAAWNWKANGAGVTNTAGSITSTVSANPTAGFSIVTYTGTGSAATVGHGLGVAPAMVIVKRRDSATNGDWFTYHASLGNANAIYLNLTSASAASGGAWNNTSPTSSVFTVGTSSGVNASGSTYVAYCFAEVPGYSRFGSYTGNGSADGPFIFTGFRPRFIMIKAASSTGSWLMLDTARSTFNIVSPYLTAENSGAEGWASPFDWLDITANGFKNRNTGSWHNTNGVNYIYMAFAENPFKYSLAR